jgi:hypothetical protein
MLYYLASPYTSDDPRIEEARYQIAIATCALLLKKGIPVYSPIVHWHVIAEQYFDIPYSTYLKNDLEHLQNCNGLIVLTTAGWQESNGVQAEIAMALELAQVVGFSIQYFSPTTGELTDEPRTSSN